MFTLLRRYEARGNSPQDSQHQNWYHFKGVPNSMQSIHLLDWPRNSDWKNSFFFDQSSVIGVHIEFQTVSNVQYKQIFLRVFYSSVYFNRQALHFVSKDFVDDNAHPLKICWSKECSVCIKNYLRTVKKCVFLNCRVFYTSH